MAFTLAQNAAKQDKQTLLKLKKQMQSLQNEMEFVEILAQFWPFPNMARKMERLEQKLEQLKRQYAHYSALQAV
jgi:predicted RNase H-like nuclease (RuvC/YqgF family)